MSNKARIIKWDIKETIELFNSGKISKGTVSKRLGLDYSMVHSLTDENNCLKYDDVINAI